MSTTASTCCAGSGQPTGEPTETTVSSCCASPATGSAKSIYTDAVSRLVAVGAAIAAHCEPCFKYHSDAALKLGVSREDLMLAVKTAQSVKETPAKAMLDLAHRFLDENPCASSAGQSCCG